MFNIWIPINYKFFELTDQMVNNPQILYRHWIDPLWDLKNNLVHHYKGVTAMAVKLWINICVVEFQVEYWTSFLEYKTDTFNFFSWLSIVKENSRRCLPFPIWHAVMMWVFWKRITHSALHQLSWLFILSVYKINSGVNSTQSYVLHQVDIKDVPQLCLCAIWPHSPAGNNKNIIILHLRTFLSWFCARPGRAGQLVTTITFQFRTSKRSALVCGIGMLL